MCAVSTYQKCAVFGVNENFYARPAVAKFWRTNERHYTLPNQEICIKIIRSYKRVKSVKFLSQNIILYFFFNLKNKPGFETSMHC